MNNENASVATALQRFEPAVNVYYSIESVAQLTQTSRHAIAVYCLHHLIAPVTQPEEGGWWFDREAVQTLRQIDNLRTDHHLNWRAIKMIGALLKEIDELRDELIRLRRS